MELTIGKLISAIHRKAHQSINLKLKDYDIDVGQIFLLRYICRNDGISQEQVAQNLYIDKTTVSKSVKRLLRLGYLKRTVNQKDQREYQLFATERAINLAPEMEKIHKEINKTLVNKLSSKEQELLQGILEKIINNFED